MDFLVSKPERPRHVQRGDVGVQPAGEVKPPHVVGLFLKKSCAYLRPTKFSKTESTGDTMYTCDFVLNMESTTSATTPTGLLGAYKNWVLFTFMGG